MTAISTRRVLHAFTAAPWAIRRLDLEALAAIVEAWANGATVPGREISAARPPASPTQMLGADGSIAVLPLVGVLAPRANLITDSSGGTSLDVFRAQFRRLVADPSVRAIVLRIDSPGGSVVGVPETFDDVMSARGKKPIIASIDALAASAALWIASACDAIEITPSGDAGSLGVYAMHVDESGANAASGVVITYITSTVSPFKTEGNSNAPLSEDARAYTQGRVDAVATDFLNAVALGRKLPASTVRARFGQGRTMSAPDALAAGMVDRVATFEETIARLAGGSMPASRRSFSTRQAQAQVDEEAILAVLVAADQGRFHRSKQ